jgi:hypothetical protein
MYWKAMSYVFVECYFLRKILKPQKVIYFKMERVKRELYISYSYLVSHLHRLPIRLRHAADRAAPNEASRRNASPLNTKPELF